MELDPNIIAAWIGFWSVLAATLISFVVSMIQTRVTLRSKVKELLFGIEQKLIEKRLEYYPKIYTLLSELAKNITKSEFGIRKGISTKELQIFKEEYDKLNSEYAVIFSRISAKISAGLRRKIYETLQRREGNSEDELDSYEMIEIKKFVQSLELSLKKDLGIFDVESKEDFKKLDLDKIEDVRAYIAEN